MSGGIIAGPALEVVTQAVYDTLTGAEPLQGVTVLWGAPTGASPTELVAVGFGPEGESWDAEADWVGLGRVTVDERFTLNLGVEVVQASGADLKPAFTRSREIVEAVQAVLRGDPEMKAAETAVQIRAVKFTRIRGRYFRTDKARGHRVFLTITGIARI